MWTARITEGNYYRFYCPFDLESKTLGEIGVNRFKVGQTVNDFSFSGIRNALAREGVPCKKMYSDIGFEEIQETEYTFGGRLFREMQMVRQL